MNLIKFIQKFIWLNTKKQDFEGIEEKKEVDMSERLQLSPENQAILEWVILVNLRCLKMYFILLLQCNSNPANSVRWDAKIGLERLRWGKNFVIFIWIFMEIIFALT